MPYYEVEFTVIVHLEAEDEDKAFDQAEPIAQESARKGAWSCYDDCVREINERDM
jgi:hypothetical protein